MRLYVAIYGIILKWSIIFRADKKSRLSDNLYLLWMWFFTIVPDRGRIAIMEIEPIRSCASLQQELQSYVFTRCFLRVQGCFMAWQINRHVAASKQYSVYGLIPWPWSHHRRFGSAETYFFSHNRGRGVYLCETSHRAYLLSSCRHTLKWISCGSGCWRL